MLRNERNQDKEGRKNKITVMSVPTQKTQAQAEAGRGGFIPELQIDAVSASPSSRARSGEPNDINAAATTARGRGRVGKVNVNESRRRRIRNTRRGRITRLTSSQMEKVRTYLDEQLLQLERDYNKR